MSKITLNQVGNLIDAVTAQTTINTNNALIQTAFDNTLSRDGTTPNNMGSNFDMNSYQVLNLPPPATANSPLRLQDLERFIGSGTISTLPAGGTTNQMLVKLDGTDYNVGWHSINSLLVAGSNVSITGTSQTTIGVTTTPIFTTVNGLTINSTTGSLVIGNGKTFTVSNTLSLSNTDGASVLFGTGGTVAYTSANLGQFASTTSAQLRNVMSDETGTGVLVFGTSPTLTTPVIASIVNTGTLTLPTSTDTLVGRATTDTLTNKTFNTAGTGNVFQINGTGITAVTGTGSVVLATSPTLTTPNIGAATATSVNGLIITASTGTLTIANGKTHTISNAIAFTGTDSTSFAFPATSGTVATLNTAQTFTAVQTINIVDNGTAGVSALNPAVTRTTTSGSGGIFTGSTLSVTDNGTTAALSNQAFRLNMTLNSTTPSSAFDACVVLNPGANQNTGIVYGIQISGIVVAAGKTVANSTGITISAPTGAGTVTTKQAINAAAGSGFIIGIDGIQTGVTTVAALPAASAGNKGVRLFVTDANAATFGTTAAAGGANNVPVVSNGTVWIIG